MFLVRIACQYVAVHHGAWHPVLLHLEQRAPFLGRSVFAPKEEPPTLEQLVRSLPVAIPQKLLSRLCSLYSELCEEDLNTRAWAVRSLQRETKEAVTALAKVSE